MEEIKSLVRASSREAIVIMLGGTWNDMHNLYRILDARPRDLKIVFETSAEAAKEKAKLLSMETGIKDVIIPYNGRVSMEQTMRLHRMISSDHEFRCNTISQIDASQLPKKIIKA